MGRATRALKRVEKNWVHASLPALGAASDLWPGWLSLRPSAPSLCLLPAACPGLVCSPQLFLEGRQSRWSHPTPYQLLLSYILLTSAKTLLPYNFEEQEIEPHEG